MNNDSIKVTGHLDIILTDKDGNVKDQRSIPNLVVTVGKTLILERMINSNPGATYAVMSHMGLGTDGTGLAAGNTALGAQWGTRQPLSPAPTRSGNVITYSCTFGENTPTSTITSVQEAGIFNSATVGSGTMLCRTTFATITKGPNDILTINWNVTIN